MRFEGFTGFCRHCMGSTTGLSGSTTGVEGLGVSSYLEGRGT